MKDVDSNKDMLLLKKGTVGVVVVVGGVVEEGPEEARITKLPHGVCKQNSLFNISLPWATNFSYTRVKYDSNFFSQKVESFSHKDSRGPLKWYS